MQRLLLLSLLSPLVEAFPNLYMSWWAPSNGNLRRYLDAWPRRVAVVLVVWLPILITLAKITEPVAALVIAALVFFAFGLRLYVFDRYLGLELAAATGGPAPGKLSKVPEILYAVAFSSLGFVLYTGTPDRSWMVPVAIGILWLGASMMATFRRGPRVNLQLDVLGRGVFAIGFVLNLYNLDRAASSVLAGVARCLPKCQSLRPPSRLPEVPSQVPATSVATSVTTGGLEPKQRLLGR